IATAGDVARELEAIEAELAEETLSAPAGGEAVGPTTILPRRTTTATPPLAPGPGPAPGDVPPPPPMLRGTGAAPAPAGGGQHAPTTRVTSRAVDGPPRPAAEPPEGGPVVVPGVGAERSLETGPTGAAGGGQSGPGAGPGAGVGAGAGSGGVAPVE